MPIITKPSPLEKDATGVFTLDKTALALHPLVSESAHFSSPNVWDKIIVKYKSETLGQFESIEFEASSSTPEGQFFVSATAEDVFEVEKITIIDKDGAILLIPRASLTVAEFDIDFAAAPLENLWSFYAEPDAIVDDYKILFNGATGSGVRRQAFTKLIANSKTGAEFYFNPSYGFNYCVGLIGLNADPTSFSVGQNLSDFFYDPSRQFVIWFASNGSGATIYKNTTSVASIGDSISTSDKIGCFIDPITKTIQFTKNGSNIGSSVSFADLPSYTQLRLAGYRGDSLGEIGLSSTITYPVATFDNIA